MITLQVIWFLLVGILLAGYAVLDGFDLGVGFWHLRARGDRERRTLLAAIGPVWDGNEVWLITGAGALFAAFPPVYATTFSGFYLAMMLLIASLIFRAVSLEFRSKVEDKRWRQIWDVAFSVSSTLAAFLFGVAVGNLLRGIPLDTAGNYTGTFFELLNPYALVIGLFSVSMMAAHGGFYAAMKADGELGKRAQKWAANGGIVEVVLFSVITAWSLFAQPHLLENFARFPALFIVPLIAVAALVGAMVMGRRGKDGRAFALSAISVVTMVGTVGASLFPRWVPALGQLERSLTIYNSSSSELTLTVMLVLALIGMPIVIGYTIWIYRIFAGKVQVEDSEY